MFPARPHEIRGSRVPYPVSLPPATYSARRTTPDCGGVHPCRVATYTNRQKMDNDGYPRLWDALLGAHTLADMVRTDAHQLRAVAADSPGLKR